MDNVLPNFTPQKSLNLLINIILSKVQSDNTVMLPSQSVRELSVYDFSYPL